MSLVSTVGPKKIISVNFAQTSYPVSLNFCCIKRNIESMPVYERFRSVKTSQRRIDVEPGGGESNAILQIDVFRRRNAS